MSKGNLILVQGLEIFTRTFSPMVDLRVCCWLVANLYMPVFLRSLGGVYYSTARKLQTDRRGVATRQRRRSRNQMDGLIVCLSYHGSPSGPSDTGVLLRVWPSRNLFHFCAFAGKNRMFKGLKLRKNNFCFLNKHPCTNNV